MLLQPVNTTSNKGKQNVEKQLGPQGWVIRLSHFRTYNKCFITTRSTARGWFKSKPALCHEFEQGLRHASTSLPLIRSRMQSGRSYMDTLVGTSGIGSQRSTYHDATTRPRSNTRASRSSNDPIQLPTGQVTSSASSAFGLPPGVICFDFE